ncbi:MAG TPA: hypothetical protein ENJ62_01600 [Bryobacterales bacterium]|nr:hypothetical protein [Bryobacterales bacterium]
MGTVLRTVVIGGDDELHRRLETVFLETGRFGLVRSLAAYPDVHELERLLRVHAPHVVFLCSDDLAAFAAVKRTLDEAESAPPVVAFGRDADPRVLMELMKLGVCQFLPAPFRTGDVLEIAARIESYLEEHPVDTAPAGRLFSFLPAKPGVGASTLAVNLAAAMAEADAGDLLLADFDFNSGLIAFILKLNPSATIIDAALRSGDLDEDSWSQLVTRAGGFDVLPCGRPEPGVRVEPLQVHRLVSFAGRLYDVVLADLSGNMEKYSIEVMTESKRIFLVTTPEIPPLHLARNRIEFFRSVDLTGRVSVLLNRWTKRSPLTKRQIEEFLEVPVFETFANDYEGVHAALAESRPISPRSELGRQIRRAACRILDSDACREDETPGERRFMDCFSILSRKYSFSRR